jgi:hypothetical protein
MRHLAFSLQLGVGMADENNAGPSIPKGTDEENPVIDTASSKPLREAKIEEPELEEPRKEPNPPRTTWGIFTAPKFGSAGSGGAELEPGPERD